MTVPTARYLAEVNDAPTSEFDRATAVTPGGDPNRFTAEIDPGWSVGTKPNGGYLLAMTARAAGEALGLAESTHRDPLSATAHFLRAPDPGPTEVRTEVLRTGRSASQVRASLWQNDACCVDAAFTMGTLADSSGTAPFWTDHHPVEVAPIDECMLMPSSRPDAEFSVPIMDRCQLHVDPANLGFAVGTPSGRGEIRGWMSLADDRPLDALALLFVADALPPATFEIVNTGWVPTLSLSVAVRAVPAPGPVRVRQAVGSIDDGRFDETCQIWDGNGRLVAQATQLAAIRLPPDANMTT